MIRRILALILLLVYLSACILRPRQVVLLTPVSIVPSTSIAVPFDQAKLGTVERKITYCTMDGVSLKMDVYYPTAMDGAWPVVMYVHGGAWVKGDKSEGAGMGDQSALTADDFLYISINYRLAPEYKFPAMIEDAKCAVRYLRAHASQYNLDPQRVGALGGSAGGHLVSLLGLSDESAGWDVGEYLDQSSRVQAVVDYFGPADLTDSSFDTERAENRTVEVFGASEQSDPILAAASPVTYATPDDPPFFIAHGDKDDTVPLAQSQILYDKLTATGIPVELVIVHNAGHGFVPTGGAISPTRMQISQMVVEFFSQHLK